MKCESCELAGQRGSVKVRAALVARALLGSLSSRGKLQARTQLTENHVWRWVVWTGGVVLLACIAAGVKCRTASEDAFNQAFETCLANGYDPAECRAAIYGVR